MPGGTKENFFQSIEKKKWLTALKIASNIKYENKNGCRHTKCLSAEHI